MFLFKYKQLRLLDKFFFNSIPNVPSEPVINTFILDIPIFFIIKNQSTNEISFLKLDLGTKLILFLD